MLKHSSDEQKGPPHSAAPFFLSGLSQVFLLPFHLFVLFEMGSAV